jgi:hypothetical protein
MKEQQINKMAVLRNRSEPADEEVTKQGST